MLKFALSFKRLRNGLEPFPTTLEQAVLCLIWNSECVIRNYFFHEKGAGNIVAESFPIRKTVVSDILGDEEKPRRSAACSDATPCFNTCIKI